MCMSEAAEFDCSNEGIGYKVLERYSETVLYGPYTSQEEPYKLDKEYQSKPSNYTRYNNGEPYKSGFHIFLTLEDAKHYIGDACLECVYEVKYRNVLAKGIQDKGNCITTEYMTVVKECYRPLNYNPDGPYEDDDWGDDDDDDFIDDDWNDDDDFMDEDDEWDDECDGDF